MPDLPRCIGFGDQEGECAYSATTPGGLYCAPCEDARRTHVNAVLAEVEDGQRTLPQPLGQTDCKILECLERVDGALAITVANLLFQLNECELADVGIGLRDLCERLTALDRAGLVDMRGTNFPTVKIAPAGRDFLPPSTPPRVPDALEVGVADEIRQSPARAATGSEFGDAA